MALFLYLKTITEIEAAPAGTSWFVALTDQTPAEIVCVPAGMSKAN